MPAAGAAKPQGAARPEIRGAAGGHLHRPARRHRPAEPPPGDGGHPGGSAPGRGQGAISHPESLDPTRKTARLEGRAVSQKTKLFSYLPRMESLIPPTVFWTLPSALSILPSVSILESPTALPTPSLMLPLVRSLSMVMFLTLKCTGRGTHHPAKGCELHPISSRETMIRPLHL